MPAAADVFSYAIFRLVPRVDRGERMNVGVAVFCARLQYVGARTALDEARATALWPDLDLEPVRRQLAGIEAVAAGEPAAGPIARLEPSQRFHWLVSPASTIIQPSPVHTGLCERPGEQLDRLFTTLVPLPPAA